MAAITLLLDFGDGLSVPDFAMDPGTSEMRYNGVATGVNASITALSTIVRDPANTGSSLNADRNGNILGDARIQLPAGESATFTLSLWNASVGDGFSTLFSDSEGWEWTLAVYDLDHNKRHSDLFTLLSPAEYNVTTSTGLTITDTGTSVSFSGLSVGTNDGVTGDEGLPAFITQEQADASVGLKITNISTLMFGYEAKQTFDPDGRPLIGGRTMLIDGVSLYASQGDFGPLVTDTLAPVPLPAAGVLLIAGLGVLGGAKRLRKTLSV